MLEISFIGVLIGLAVAIGLMIKQLNPMVSMFLGAIVGSLVGGANLDQVLHNIIIQGGQSSVGIMVRILAGGVLTGVLIESGAAETIAKTIVEKLGEKRVLPALAIASALLLLVGVFLTVSVVILAPIALSVAKKTKISKMAIIVALSGGAKAGNIVSPNPNAIAAAEAFDLPLTDVMINGFIPGILGLIATILIANTLVKKGPEVSEEDFKDTPDASTTKLPSFGEAMVGPIVAIALLMITPVANILGIGFLQDFRLDPFIALPVGALVGALIMRRERDFLSFTNAGVVRVTPIVLMLFGAGTLSSMITNSDFPGLILGLIDTLGISAVFLAPISGTIMGSAAGSAAIGSAIASQSFGDVLLAYGVPAISAAVMIHAGVMFFDIVPHGNYFQASKDSVKVTIMDRIKCMPYEAVIGGIMTVTATIVYGFILG